MPFAFEQPSGFGRWISGDTSSLSVNAAPLAATAWEAEARFAGAGSLSALATQEMQGAATFAGSGGLSVGVSIVSQAAATFAGAGALSVNAGVYKYAHATFVGAGSLTATARLTLPASAVFAGVGSLSVLAQLKQQGAAVFSGLGALSVSVRQSHAAQATFAGSGALSVDTDQVSAGGEEQQGEARFVGAGALSVATRQAHSCEVRLQGAGNLAVAAGLVQQIGARFDGAGGLSSHAIDLTPLIPDGDDSTGGWLTEVDSLPLYPSLDEMVPLDADYIKSSAAPAVDICKISLSNPTTGSLVAPVSVLYRYGKSGTDTAQLQVRLLQGSSMIAVWQHDDIQESFVTVEQLLTEGMVTNITDWNDLFLEFRSGTITTHMGRATFSGAGAVSSPSLSAQMGRATFNGIGGMSSYAPSSDTTAPSVPEGVLGGPSL